MVAEVGEVDAVERHESGHRVRAAGHSIPRKMPSPISGEKSHLCAKGIGVITLCDHENCRNPRFFWNWHAPCKPVFIRLEGPSGIGLRGNEMTATSNFSQRLFGLFAAFGMTTFMLVASFQAPSAHAVQAMFA
jgi:hypothetical protein